METAVQKQELPSYRWVILILTVITFIITFFIRFSWPPLIPVVVPILKMKMSQAGAYMSIFYIGYIITQIPGGVLSDRFGVRAILALSLIIEGVSTFFMGYIVTYDQGFILRLITGLGAGAVYGACARALMEWFPPKERGTAFGIMLAAPSGGIVLSSLIVLPLNAAIGWEGAFKISGLISVVVGIVIFILVKTSKETIAGGNMFGGFPIVFGNKDLILTALAGFCLMWVELGTATWTVAHIKKLGFSLGAAGSIMLSYGIGGIIGPFLSGWISDKIGYRKWILVVSYAIIIPVTLIFGFQTTIPMLVVVGFFFGFFSYIANPHLTVLVSEFAGKQWAALANGTSNVIFQIAPIIGPWIMGWSIDVTGKFSSVWWLMAAGPLVGIVLLLFINEANKRD
jgi:ACS family hexuronate transporter-like MFS transporter